MPVHPLVSRRWFSRVACGASLALAAGCREKKEPQMIDPSDLDRIKMA